jgi:hypothetical protein
MLISTISIGMMLLLSELAHIVSNQKISEQEHPQLRSFGLIQRLSPRESNGTSQEELFCTILMVQPLEEVQTLGHLHTSSIMIKMAVLLTKQQQFQLLCSVISP